MRNELLNKKKNNQLVSIFCDEDDSTTFLAGYIYAVGTETFLIKHITPHGLADGYILKHIDSVVHLEMNGTYEKKIEKLYLKRNQKHTDLNIQEGQDLEENILQICMEQRLLISIEIVKDDECPIKGFLSKIEKNKLVISKVTEDGEKDGEAILKRENIDTISFLGVDEEDINLLME